MHAGELETSILLAAHPGYRREGWQHDDHHAPDRPHLITLGVRAYTSSGVIGYPSAATAAKGHAVINQLAANSDSIIKILRTST